MSTLTPVELLELEQLRAEQTEARETAYVELVQALVEGYELDEFSAMGVIRASGRTIDNFERDLDQYRVIVAPRRFGELLWRAKFDAMRREAINLP